MNKKTWLISAPQLSIIGFIFFNILAMVLYPGGTLHDRYTTHYSFFNNFLSDLGRFHSWYGDAKSIPNFFSMIFFNGTMIITGVVFSLYFINLRSIFNLRIQDSTFSENNFLYCISILGTICGISGGLSMIGVGLTPADLYFPSHLAFAHWLFRFFFLAATCYTIIILRTDLIENKYVIGFFIFAILIFFYIIFSEFGPDANKNLRALMMQVTAQKSILFCFLIAIYIQTKGLYFLLED